MMSKKKVIFGALLTCICITFAIGYFGFRTSAEKATIVDCDIRSEYQRGDEFVMPDGKVSYKGEEKKADSKYVVFPSGKANESETIVLSEEGEYELVFKTKVNGTVVSAKKTFVVKKALLEVNSEYSSAKIENNKINVSLATDDTFTYNAKLDLASATKENTLLDMEFAPISKGNADATKVKIRLTDLYDEENYVEVTLKNLVESWANGIIYISAGAANQPQVGLENVEVPENTNVHIDNKFGTPVNFSMVGLPNSSMDTHLKLYFDYNEKAFYVDREVYSGGAKRIIVDLDDPEIFGEALWSGFTTGEVKMSISASDYQAPSCNFMISTVCDNSEFQDIGDVELPLLSVRSEYGIDEVPVALVGKPYQTFDAEAVDVYDGKIETTTAVYYKYYSEKPVKISVIDGKFTPAKEGTYVIEYSATDLSGNVATECVKVQAVKGEGLQVELKDIVTETTSGTPVKVFSELHCTDSSGKVSHSVTAKNKATDEEIKIDSETLEFIPMSDGEWEITVTVKDYVSTVKKTFDVKSNHTTQPQTYDKVGIPNYFILGATYNLPDSVGYDFSSGKGIASNMEVFVTESGSSETKLENTQYIPKKTGKVKVTYRLTVDGKSCEKSYEANVVDVGYTGDLDLGKYFVATEGTVTTERNASSVIYEVKKNAKLDFINFVQVKDFAFSFQVGAKSAYNKIHIYLSDVVNGKQVKLSYNRTAEGVTFSVNDGMQQKLTSYFDGEKENYLLEFNNDTYLALANSEVDFKVNQFLDGSEFVGFTDSVARFSIEIEDAAGASQFVVTNLNAQPMNNSKVDRFAPQIIVDTKAGDRGKGEKVELKGAFAHDTLDPNCVMTMDVTDPDGEYVKDENGVSLDGTQDPEKDYVFEVNSYGDYTIRYVVTDGKGKTDEYIYAVTSKDVIGPTIELSKHKSSAKKGNTVEVATAEVKDNITKDCKVFTYVFNPDGTSTKLVDGEFEALVSGTYTVRYIAFDEDGNYAFASYEIDVE